MVLPGEEGEGLRSPEAIRRLIEPVAPWLEFSEAQLVRSAVYRFHGLVATEWARGRVFLGGDAVHQTPPFYGQGMCHGIRDVRNLLWKLQAVCSGVADRALLTTYQMEREPHVRAIIEAAVENGRYICTLDPAVAAERDARYRNRMHNGADVESFRQVIPGLAAGLLDSEARADPAVGVLFPQPRLSDNDEEMFDDLLGPGFAVVTRRPADGRRDFGWFTDVLGGRVVHDEGALHAWFERHRCRWALVRPDRYVFGVAGDEDGLAALIERLRAMLEGRLPFQAPDGDDHRGDGVPAGRAAMRSLLHEGPR
jgi:3-(3-hydroxy-phenyl)propionate hydroxylase